jgi:AhpD family alkylhydroperoxidase
MSSEVAEFYEKWQADRRKVRADVPNIARGFGTLYQTVMKDGALSVREKELIATGIALTQRCTPCINLHVQGCLKAGATREQVLEAAGVAVMMQGGPAFTHVPEVLDALEHLEANQNPE